MIMMLTMMQAGGSDELHQICGCGWKRCLVVLGDGHWWSAIMVPVMVADREKSCSKFGAGDGLVRNWPQSGGELTKTKVHGLQLVLRSEWPRSTWSKCTRASCSSLHQLHQVGKVHRSNLGNPGNPGQAKPSNASRLLPDQ